MVAHGDQDETTTWGHPRKIARATLPSSATSNDLELWETKTSSTSPFEKIVTECDQEHATKVKVQDEDGTERPCQVNKRLKIFAVADDSECRKATDRHGSNAVRIDV